MARRSLPLSFVLLLALCMSARAEDLKPEHPMHHLDYLNYRSDTHTVEWGVSQGSLSEDGEFMSDGKPVEAYSMDIESGVLRHAGEGEPVNAEDADHTRTALDLLFRLVEDQTDNWDATHNSEPSNAVTGSPEQPQKPAPGASGHAEAAPDSSPSVTGSKDRAATRRVVLDALLMAPLAGRH